jgi:hypothetical protein
MPIFAASSIRRLFLFINVLFLSVLCSGVETTYVLSGKTVTLKASANGTGPFTYKWFKNSVLLTEQVGSSLTITNFQSTDAATYYVAVVNSAGLESSKAVVKLMTAPIFTTQPASKTLLAGSTVTFSAAATSYPSYQWRKDGVNISGATSRSYTIKNISSVHSGVYTVVAKNVLGSTTSKAATLIVGTKPVITTQPVSKKASAGSSVTFSVAATGIPAPKYQWRRNGVSIYGATGANYTINSVSALQAGFYSVVVKNSLGSATSSSASLTVVTTLSTTLDGILTTTTVTTKPPAITTQPTDRTVMAGTPTTFRVSASASPSPKYQWRRNGVAIEGATDSTYVISNTKTGHAGSYSVVVSNSVGSVTSRSATLTVKPLIHADLDGDGRSDILWENILSGEHRLWLMAGTSKISGMDLPTASKDWQIIGPGEFNADGKTDILLQNLATREVKVWLMSGTTVSSSVSLGIPASGMYVVGLGDFNADNKTDLIWRNNATNEHIIRLMIGVKAGTSVSLGIPSAGWEVVGTGDFNADRKTDIVWENSATGKLTVWKMSGAKRSSTVSATSAGLGWLVGGTGDFDRDGKPDILWQKKSTGARKVLLMSGVNKKSEVSLGTVGVEWFLRN